MLGFSISGLSFCISSKLPKAVHTELGEFRDTEP